jgi:hypothetical protein
VEFVSLDLPSESQTTALVAQASDHDAERERHLPPPIPDRVQQEENCRNQTCRGSYSQKSREGHEHTCQDREPRLLCLGETEAIVKRAYRSKAGCRLGRHRLRGSQRRRHGCRDQAAQERQVLAHNLAKQPIQPHRAQHRHAVLKQSDPTSQASACQDAHQP